MGSLKLFGIALVAVVIIDYIWLGFIAKDYYIRSYGDLARTVNGEFKPQIWAAVIVYFLLALGVTQFVIPLTTEASFLGTFLKGAFLGLIIYGVYDMTAMAVLRDWPLGNSIVDMIWGSFLCGTVTLITKTAQEYI
ncbi:hypothetical protein AZI86_10375 [Bdellovibrio bacteriovorus]|uniref:DUF2177 domain-containing protein n=1 Tax=Bdellovibrio bacteriovorus TaxID=959 RepID=A0A150WSX8_BDEBC|nr:DUF2177 family protein [Bdellovibrio bacteriovorus]KYG67389.1 hypothetical protein AZI86_10375 [Bdellovibrio bacteriovorus]